MQNNKTETNSQNVDPLNSVPSNDQREPESEEYDGFLNKINIRSILDHIYFFIFMQIFGLALYIFDVYSDFALSIKYLRDREYLSGSLTLIFIIISSTYIICRSHRRRKELPFDKCTNFLKASLIGVLGLEPAFCHVRNISYAVNLNKAQKKSNQDVIETYKKLKLAQSYDLAELKFFEVLLEATPQIILQFSIMINSQNIKFLQILSVVTSLLALSLTLFSCNKEEAASINLQFTLPGLAISTFSGYCILISRIMSYTSISFFFTVVPAAIAGYPVGTAVKVLFDWFLIKKYPQYRRDEPEKNIINSAATIFRRPFLPILNDFHSSVIHLVGFFSEIFTVIILTYFSTKTAVKNRPVFTLIFVLAIFTFILGTVCNLFFVTRKKKFVNEIMVETVPNQQETIN